MLTFEQIKELIELVAERGLDGLKIERSGFSLRIQGKQSQRVAAPVAAMAPPVMAESGPQLLAPANLPSSASPPVSMDQAAAEPDIAEGNHVLLSPIVGTFYRAPSPDSEDYVEVGTRVKVGQTLCIVEAMKVMNEIESDANGVIVEISPNNSQPVEYGERLFVINTD